MQDTLMQTSVGREMPRYKCHKEVWALKIKHIQMDHDANYFIVPAEEGYGAIQVTADFIHKHQPHRGGYYVVYQDGYQSFSPAAAFEEGYAKV